MSRHSRSATHKPIEFVIPVSSACRHVRIERRGLATACTLAAAAMLLAGAVTAGAQNAGPPEYGYDSIPFGNTAQQIIRELSGATIEEAGSEAHFINHYEVLPDFFAEGLEPDWLGIQQQLNVDVTRMYRVSYVGWINVVALELFFYREHDAPDELGSYRLFMVRKTLKTAGSGSHTEVSNVLTEAINGRLGGDPVSYDVKFVPGLAARISKWEMADSDIFLLVFQNIFSASDADILYRDREQWGKYVAAHRQEAGQQTRAAGSSF